MKHPVLLPPLLPLPDETVDASASITPPASPASPLLPAAPGPGAPAAAAPPDPDALDEALAEVDEMVAWSDSDGWSRADLADAIRVDDGIEDDDDEEPPTVRSPSGIRLSLESGRPVAVADSGGPATPAAAGDASSVCAVDGFEDDDEVDSNVA